MVITSSNIIKCAIKKKARSKVPRAFMNIGLLSYSAYLITIESRYPA